MTCWTFPKVILVVDQSPNSAIRTTCPYCGVGCGLVVANDALGRVSITGDPDHPANFGRVCSKGAALDETLSLDGRLLHPMIQGKPSSWDDALSTIAGKFSETLEHFGPESVAMYLSGQLLTEDYYVANKFMKGFVGSANVDTNSRLCMASSVAAHKRAFGSDTVPGCYEDLELADLVVVAGSNLAWCHPVIYQRLMDSRESHEAEIVVIDPRRTATSQDVDLHLAIKPGTDVLLWNALLRYIVENNLVDEAFVKNHVDGLQETLAAADSHSIDETAELTGLTPTDVRNFFAMFASCSRVVTLFSQGVNQSTAGTDKVNALINCHLATGQIGKPGSTVFSMTGQPNAMGGREVGGMANMLAAHMEIENQDHRRIVSEHWSAPRLVTSAGLKAVDLFKAVHSGQIKLLWIMATNPAASMPDNTNVKEALEVCPFVVVSDVVEKNDTLKFADIQLPSLAWGEKDGTVTNSDRVISRQRAFLPSPEEARADWWQITQVAKRLGYVSEFDYVQPSVIFQEHVALTARENRGDRDIDLNFLLDENYETSEPKQWGPEATNRKRFFSDGQFYTANRKAQMVPVRYRGPRATADSEFPFVLVTGRIRDQWHTMTRTAKSARLLSHIDTPGLMMHPEDAEGQQLKARELVTVRNATGLLHLPIEVSSQVRKGTVFANMHWNDTFASNACADKLIPSNVDPISGQPEFKAVPVSIEPWRVGCYGYLLSVEKPNVDDLDYWTMHEVDHGWQLHFALKSTPDDLGGWLVTTVSTIDRSGVETIDYTDPARGDKRCIRYSGHRVMETVFISDRPIDVSYEWLRKSIGIEVEDSLRILSGVPEEPTQNKGDVVCACLGIGKVELQRTLDSGESKSVQELINTTGAGSNCGTCLPELAGFVNEYEDFLAIRQIERIET